MEDISKHLAVGQEVKVKVISVDDNGKIGLSIKRTLGDAPKRKKRDDRRDSDTGLGNRPPEVFEFAHAREDMSFEDKLLKFKQDSDEKIQDLKRNTEGKRSGGYKRAY